MADLHWTEVDQVTTVWTDTPGPLQAGLLFRTGRADETLATSGITHLIEHLSLSEVNDQSQLVAGFVDGVVTSFLTRGQPEDVANVLANICAALNSLPGDRLESEKQVLAAEHASRTYNLPSDLLFWRYGTVGYGLLGLPEFGLKKITPEQLQNYSAERFTRENAFLWLSGPPPKDLRLILPHGKKQPLPCLTPVKNPFPYWHLDNHCGGVAAGITVSRVYAAMIFCGIASRRLHKHLRTDQALSYAPSVFYDPLNSDIAHLVLYADSDESHRADLAKAFAEVFEQLNVIALAEIKSVRNQILEHSIGPLAPPSADIKMMEVQRVARDWVFGNEYESLEMMASRYNSVTEEDVSSFARDLQANAIFALPGGARILPCFGKGAISSIEPVVDGQKAIKVDSPIQQEVLVYSPEGVSVLWTDGTHTTVRFSELAAVLSYEDGCLLLIGSDRWQITIEPTLWRNGTAICSEILEQVPEQLLIDQGPRPANAIPQPTTTAWQRFRTRYITYILVVILPIIFWIVRAILIALHLIPPG
jgi:predicted Zn-dependent peptidase